MTIVIKKEPGEFLKLYSDFYNHTEETWLWASEIWSQLKKIMTKEFKEYWELGIEEISAIICYWIISDITEEKKFNYHTINFILGTYYKEEELMELRDFFIKKLKYDIMIYKP